jgi:hypothetical protein
MTLSRRIGERDFRIAAESCCPWQAEPAEKDLVASVEPRIARERWPGAVVADRTRLPDQQRAVLTCSAFSAQSFL